MVDWVSGKRPYILGHRGASADAPENTIAAFVLALEQGADGIELDVQFSKDGVLVIYHDMRLDPKMGRSERIADLILAELKALDAGEGLEIPTLDEVFEALGPTALYNVEIKDWRLWDGGTETAVADRIQSHNLERQCHISSFNPFSVRRARRHLTRSSSTGILRQKGVLKFSYLFTPSDADHPQHSMIDETYMAWARRHGYQVHTWTVDDPAEAQRLAQLGVDGIITNKPAVIYKAIR